MSKRQLGRRDDPARARWSKRIALVALVLAVNAGAKASELRVAPRQMARTSEFAERARRSLARPVDVVQFLEVEQGATNVGGPHHRHRAGELGNSLPWRGAASSNLTYSQGRAVRNSKVIV